MRYVLNSLHCMWQYDSQCRLYVLLMNDFVPFINTASIWSHINAVCDVYLLAAVCVYSQVNTQRMLDELHRVLSPGGRFITFSLHALEEVRPRYDNNTLYDWKVSCFHVKSSRWNESKECNQRAVAHTMIVCDMPLTKKQRQNVGNGKDVGGEVTYAGRKNHTANDTTLVINTNTTIDSNNSTTATANQAPILRNRPSVDLLWGVEGILTEERVKVMRDYAEKVGELCNFVSNFPHILLECMIVST